MNISNIIKIYWDFDFGKFKMVLKKKTIKKPSKT